ncbi:MAG: hypothetical protein QM604_00220 [Microbacterium sp.]
MTDITAGMRRVILGGPGLAAHIAANGYPVARDETALPANGRWLEH